MTAVTQAHVRVTALVDNLISRSEGTVCRTAVLVASEFGRYGLSLLKSV